jgi:hypothetical protein
VAATSAVEMVIEDEEEEDEDEEEEEDRVDEEWTVVIFMWRGSGKGDGGSISFDPIAITSEAFPRNYQCNTQRNNTSK